MHQGNAQSQVSNSGDPQVQFSILLIQYIVLLSHLGTAQFLSKLKMNISKILIFLWYSNELSSYKLLETCV